MIYEEDPRNGPGSGSGSLNIFSQSSVASVTSGLVQDDMLKTIKAADNAMKRLRFIICLLVMSIV